MTTTEAQRHRGDQVERDPLTAEIISAALEVHRALGPGLLESAYEECLCHELHLRGIRFQRQLDLPLLYKAVRLGCGYQVDLLVEDTVVVELKAVDCLNDVHDAQLLTYLRLLGKRVGLLINFNVSLLKNGIRRRVL